MARDCLVILSTSAGSCIAEIRVDSLHQLALVMPATVISYEVRDNGECGVSKVGDEELFELLTGVIRDAKLNSNS